MGVSIIKSRDYSYIILLRDHCTRRVAHHRSRICRYFCCSYLFFFFFYNFAHIEPVLETPEELLEPQSVSVIDRLSP